MKRLFILIPALMSAVMLRSQPAEKHDLRFTQLAITWDEALPLGNGVLGALVWEKDKVLRLSLDRADIWDLRPMKGLHRKEFSFDWVREQVLKNDYKPVQEYFDVPYDREPAPSKIPAAALEFKMPVKAEVVSARLMLENALCEVKWDNGLVLKTFVHASEPVGWFRFENIPGDIIPELVPPPYQGKSSGNSGAADPVAGDDLSRLGYPEGTLRRGQNEIIYAQEGWGGFVYRVSVRFTKTGPNALEGVWSISSHYPGQTAGMTAARMADQAFDSSFSRAFDTHRAWWKSFWSKSAIQVPDTLLEKQWYLEQYKFGSVARSDSPPVSLQAVWTADNGRIPPWKGDFHHDLNTQLSYWPAYSANRLNEAMGYLNHLVQNKPNYRRYTRQYFGVDGLAVPGVTTLDGTEMGGWIQYSLSPTVSAWLAQHYYLQWRYSMDREFLKDRAYPWFGEVCRFLEQITFTDERGLRKLPLSSSPEINDNHISAWFLENTNYDLALMKFAFGAASELARELGLADEAKQWEQVLGGLGGYALTDRRELKVAPAMPYKKSHRHFSHLMAIHPLGLICWEDDDEARSIIRNSLAQLEAVGSDYWCGYSWSWLGNLYARAKDGQNAVRALQVFARAFCLPNSFHVNGDQTGSGYSTMTYRPFTLEGNFAFAAGLQEMLLQSYGGFIEVMPAVPEDWHEVSFRQLRAEGAFLVTADRKEGRVTEIRIESETGGEAKLRLPFEKWRSASQVGVASVKEEKGILYIQFTPGGRLTVKMEK